MRTENPDVNRNRTVLLHELVRDAMGLRILVYGGYMRPERPWMSSTGCRTSGNFGLVGERRQEGVLWGIPKWTMNRRREAEKVFGANAYIASIAHYLQGGH